MLPVLEISADHLSTFSLAAQQNAYPLFRNLSLLYKGGHSDDSSPFPPALKNIVVKLRSEPEIFSSEEWPVDDIRPGQLLSLQKRPLQASHDILFGLTEETRVTISITVVSTDDPETTYAEKTTTVAVLPANFWGGESRQPDLLAAFVKPNGVYVESLVRQVTELLAKNGHGRSADGYQSNTRDKPYIMASALWNVIFSQRLAYVSPPQDFARMGQRIRLAADISASRISACLDTSVLFASCLELMGLNPVIALTQEHAFVGVWLIDKSFPVLTNDDPVDLRKRVDARDLILFESTLVTNEAPVTFEQAKNHARDLIREETESEFVYVIDIKQARSRKIKPLASIENKTEEQSSAPTPELILSAVPPLPPVRAVEGVIARDTRHPYRRLAAQAAGLNQTQRSAGSERQSRCDQTVLSGYQRYGGQTG